MKNAYRALGAIIVLSSGLDTNSTAIAGGCSWSLGSYLNGFMPDFDQRREPGPLFFDGMQFINVPAGLPGSGSNYCSPTSHLNVMGYLSQHGFPALMPGGPIPSSWGAQSQYERVTANIFEMGDLMETDPSAGTTCCGHSGCVAYLDAHAPGKFIVSSFSSDAFYAPSIGDLAFCALAGGFVNLFVGWFENTDINQWQKTGGHVVTMVKLEGWCGGTRKVGIRDPGNGNTSLIAQSTFATNSYTLQQFPGFFDSDGTSGFDVYFQRTYERMVSYNASDGRIGLINGYRVIVPKFGVTLTPPPMQQFQMQYTIQPTNPHGSAPAVLPIATGTPVVDFALDPTTLGIIYTAEGPGGPGGANDPHVYRVERATGVSRMIHTGASPSLVAVGRSQKVYIVDGLVLKCIDMQQSPPAMQVASLTSAPDAMEYDDITDSLMCLSTAAGPHVRVFDGGDLAAPSPIYPLPGGVVLNGRPFLTISPLDGSLWIRSQNSPDIYQLSFDRILGLVLEQSANIPASVGAIGIDVHTKQTREHILLARQAGGIAEYRKNLSSGQWEADPTSDFAGFSAYGGIELARSRTNFQPEMDGPNNEEQLPGPSSPPELDCPGDVDHDGDVDFDDITFALANWLNDYTPNTGPGDANDDGITNFDDINFILSYWQNPC